ncbi:MAG: Spy/CpxP family protein refolding chaperone [Methylobacteriaceae bacterium]|nr:Spy/CpxP family protein refolding chaperone [Methylobacteriaceae bacterium]
MRLSRFILAATAAGALIAGAAAIAQTAAPPGAPPAPPFQQPAPGAGQGMNQGGMTHGQMNPGGMDPRRMEERRIAREAHRDARRAMMAEGRIAGLRGGLRLTADQERLWKPVEEALRAMPAMRQAAPPAADDPIARLRAGADRARARADAMTRLADAAAPLYASLSDEQKTRLRALTGGGMGMGMGVGMGMGMGMMGGDHRGHHMGHHMGGQMGGRGMDHGMHHGMGMGRMRGAGGQGGFQDGVSDGMRRPRMGGQDWDGPRGGWRGDQGDRMGGPQRMGAGPRWVQRPLGDDEWDDGRQ